MQHRPDHAFKMRHPYRRRIIAAAALALAVAGLTAGVADHATAATQDTAGDHIERPQ
ncbi:hypothetical protein [Glycomyces sp. NPDC047010]|uniref:hypothetical protein n=1 Tax=Glycomyces sp. NPDC047010 TaxID=3155023 RepID=UPI0033CA3AA9